MSTLTTGRASGLSIPRTGAAAVAARFAGAALSLGVAYIHVVDQGGIPGDKTPRYIGIGYWALEVVGVLVAAALLAAGGRHLRRVWLLAMGVAAGPIVGYVLSRGPGLP